jgi:hypothetical protein
MNSSIDIIEKVFKEVNTKHFDAKRPTVKKPSAS